MKSKAKVWILVVTVVVAVGVGIGVWVHYDRVHDQETASLVDHAVSSALGWCYYTAHRDHYRTGSHRGDRNHNNYKAHNH